MSTQHTNIQIKGIEFQRILEIEITHEPNAHGSAHVVGEISSERAQEYLQRADTTQSVVIGTKDEQNQIFFTGILTSIQIEQEEDYSRLIVDAKDASYLLDIRKCPAATRIRGKVMRRLSSSLMGKKELCKWQGMTRQLVG